MEKIRKYWNEKPLLIIMWTAVIVRIIAVVFSKGWGMHDDHFLVIEASQSWVDGTDYNNWLPGSNGNITPSGHSFFYVGFHYLLFSLLKVLNIFDPQMKMFVVRFLHAAFSLITVYFGFKITEKLSNTKNAKIAGLLLSIYWFMPFLSVRNLVEFTCIPFLILGIWIIIKTKPGKNILLFYFFAGLITGLAFSIRFQSLTFAGGIALAILIQKKWKETFLFGTGVLVAVFLIQGIIDYFVWGYPFAELTEYIRYNIEDAYNYNVIA